MYNNNLSAEETAYRFNLACADRILKWVDIYNNENLEKEIEILRAENAYLKKMNALVQDL